MDRFVFSKAICMNIATYRELNSKGDLLVFLLKNIFSTFVKYTVKPLVLEVDKMNGRHQQMQGTEKNINKVYNMLLKGEILYLSIRDWFESSDDPYREEDQVFHYPPDFTLQLVCNRAVDYPPASQEKCNFTNGIGLALNESLFQGIIPHEIQESFVRLFKLSLSSLSVVMGYITYETTTGFVGEGSPFENYHRLNMMFKPGYTEYLGGYHWMTYLNPNHVTKLGGLEFVIEHAPCKVMKSEEAGLILRLTNDINSYSDDQLRSLRAFLAPLFPPDTGRNEKLQFEPGQILRLVED